jgi:hypothetical protein
MITWRARAYKPRESTPQPHTRTPLGKSGTRRSPETNTQLTREIDRLTTEVHRRLLGDTTR